jgi:hypothetical protein
MWVKHAEELFKTKGKVATREIMLSYSAAIETLREAVIVKKMGVLVEVLKDIAITYSKVLEKLGKHEESGLNYEALADMVAERDPISAIRYYLTAAVTLEGVENTKRAGSVLAKRNSLLSQLASKDPHDLSGPTVSKTPAENRGRGGEIVVSTKMDDFMPEELKVDKPKISPELLSRISSLNEGDAIPPEVIRQLCLEIPSLDKSSLREALERGYGYKWSILVDMVGARTARHLRKIAQRDPSFMFKSDFSDDERKKTEKDGRLDGFEKGKGK